MKDSSWLINIPISLLKKILQKQYSFSRRYHRSARFDKGLFKEIIFFFAKLLVITTSSFSIIRTFQVHNLSSQYLTGTIPFSKHPFWKHWHNTSYMAIQLSISEDSAILNRFTLQRGTHSTRSSTSAVNNHRLSATVCEHQITSANLPLCSK